MSTAGRTKEALEKLRLAEAKYESVLAALEEETEEAARSRAAATEHATELEQLKEEGQKVASSSQFNEETTRRRLIDQALLAAGWNVGANGANTERGAAGGRLSTHAAPSRARLRRLRPLGDDGKPLAVIEAKKTAKDAQGRRRAGAHVRRRPREGDRQRAGHLLHQRLRHLDLGRRAGLPVPQGLRLLLEGQPRVPVHQRTNKKPLATVEPKLAIADRMYQLEAIKRVVERFAAKLRKALIVQATGTGKTRVAVSLCDVLMRAGWAKRILFLCDRRELRKQADRVFKEFMPGEPRVVVDSTHLERPRQAHLPRHLPGDDEVLRDFDVGFFDLIIADESHRSIYNRYRDLFEYFDALQVGLTATPVEFIERNTYELFGCEDRDPTSHFSFEEAINSNAAVPRAVPGRAFTSQFREKGIKYSQMTAEQREQLEDQDPAAAAGRLRRRGIDRRVFNKDTKRFIRRNLMENGIREATGSHVGKTIVFARNHNHAVLLAEVFSEMYPQYGWHVLPGHRQPRAKAEELIDDFKRPGRTS